MIRLLALIFIIKCSTAEFADVKKCTRISQTAENVTVDVSDCTNSTKCPLVRGTSHTITVHFTPTKNTSTNVVRKVYGVFHGIPIPYGASEKVCDTARDEQNTTCRDTGGMIAHTRYVHKSVFPVQSFFPLISLNVRYQFVDGKNVMVCVEIPVQIVKRK